jgi:hypothetical protein
MTESTYDLYWVATSPDFARMGVARGLVAAMEDEIAREGGGLIRVETGSREGHAAAAHFYDSLGFMRSAVIDDFYGADDDLLIFTKRVTTGPDVSLYDLDEAALYDAAFGYRDYAPSGTSCSPVRASSASAGSSGCWHGPAAAAGTCSRSPTSASSASARTPSR